MSNWERPGHSDGPYPAYEVLAGPQFLYLIERARTIGRDNAIALRKVSVAQTLVKAHVRGTHNDVYLVQWDSTARRFQLIGGHFRPRDIGLETTAIRELEEELNLNTFDFRSSDHIQSLTTTGFSDLSPTYGVNTAYTIGYFQLFTKKAYLRLGPGDRWVTQEELMSGQTKKGELINSSGIDILDKKLLGGLQGLRLSIETVQQLSLRDLVKNRQWEIVGIIVGVISIILSVIFFAVSR